jgi:hypothetical protein
LAPQPTSRILVIASIVQQAVRLLPPLARCVYSLSPTLVDRLGSLTYGFFSEVVMPEQAGRY